jgi:NADP-dependent 3-hydroxy acid dehydrogenase YdfG
MGKPVCAVVGVGPGNGAAIARRFAREGHEIVALARSTDVIAPLAKELGGRAQTCDAGDPASVAAAFAAIGEVDTLVWNAGSGKFGLFEDVELAGFELALAVNATGLFAAAKAVVPAMVSRGAGNLIAIGATASRRGMPRTVAFAPGKAAQKSLCEALARHLWPKGVHVALVVVDGVVDLPRTRKAMPDKPDGFFIKPDDVAETTFRTTTQPRSVWSFEVEARPNGESW